MSFVICASIILNPFFQQQVDFPFKLGKRIIQRNAGITRPFERHVDFLDDAGWFIGQNQYTVGHVERLLYAVCDEQHRTAVGFPHFEQPVLHVEPCQFIECTERLIQQHETLRAEERADEGDALAHTAGQCIRVGGFITTEPGPFQQSASSLPVDGAVYLLDQNDIILDRPPRQQGILLGQIADVAPCAVGTLTINKDITTLGIDQSADEIEDGALSAA